MYGLLLLCLFSCCHGLFPEVGVSLLESEEPECNAALTALRQGLDSHQLWAHTMVDAGAKSPVGLLSQTLVQFGDFDECLALIAPVEPQYCLFDVAPKQPANSSWSEFRWGLCVPAACSVPALRQSLQTYLDQERGWEEVVVDLVPAACTSPDTRTSSFDTSDISFSVVMLALMLTVTVCTMWDVISRSGEDCSYPPKSIVECLSARQGLASLLRHHDKALGNVDLSCLYGLHTLPFLAIIVGHRLLHQYIILMLTNFQSLMDMFENPWTSIWCRADLLVDLFFFLSSFLLGLFYYSELDKHFVNPLFVSLQRIIRVLPAYAVIVFYASTLFRHQGDGPLWHLFIDKECEKCRNNWWANLLFIHNYKAIDDLLFFFGAFLVLLVHKRPLLGVLFTGLLFIGSTIIRFLGVYQNDLIGPFLMVNRDFSRNEAYYKVFSTVYSQGHYRGTSYLVGLMTGVYVYRRRTNPLTKVQTYILESLGFAWGLVVYWSGALFFVLPEPPTLLMTALYAAFNHSAFGLANALVIVAWTLGHKTPLSRLFSWKGFVPLSKLSFATFLFSLFPQFTWIGVARSPTYYNFQEVISWSAGDLVFSLLAGLFIYLFVETPFRNIFKRLTTKSSKPELFYK